MYYDALASWESFVLQLQMAVDLHIYMDQAPVFKPADGSAEQRLDDIANAVEHLRRRLESGKYAPEDVLPLWIDATGIRSFEHSASYPDAASVLRNVARVADRFRNPAALAKDATAIPDGIYAQQCPAAVEGYSAARRARSSSDALAAELRALRFQ